MVRGWGFRVALARRGNAMADLCGTEGLLAWVLIDPLVFDLGGQV